MTAIALFGFIFTFLDAMPLGHPIRLSEQVQGCGLNNFVALNYASRHMNWLHCFGLRRFDRAIHHELQLGGQEQLGKRVCDCCLIQITLTAVLFFSLPIWRKQEQTRKSRPDGYI